MEPSEAGDAATSSPSGVVTGDTRFTPAPNGLVVAVSGNYVCTFERVACRVSVGSDGRTYFIADEKVQIGPLSSESYWVLRNLVGIRLVEKASLTDASDNTAS